MGNSDKHTDSFGEFNLDQPHALFYTDKNYFLDNFSAFAIEWRGRLWPTVEHAYQAAKFNDEQIINKIHQAKSAHESKKIAHEPEMEMFVHNDWDEIKVTVMKELLKCKIDQHAYVKRKLIETKESVLIEDSPVDSFWGRGPDWHGKNMLGKLWMELRDEILKARL